MAQDGYIVIADITGYTAFLSQSELEHAQDSLGSLLSLMLDRTRPPLVVSRLEGDAVISYASEGSFLQGQTLVETIESTYVAFRRAVERMVLNTTCTCNACKNIPSLDLKFFVHFGTFVTQRLGSQTELVGSDVNLIHRLTKNSITESTGLKAYAAYTQAAVYALGIGEMSEHMVRHAESYEHLGEATTYIQDMQVVWDRERASRRTLVRPEEALFTVELDFSLEPALLWDYVTEPECRAILAGSNSSRVDNRSQGKIGSGSVYYCAHGKSLALQTVVDWQPLEQYTVESQVLLGVAALSTVHLTPIEGGSRATCAYKHVGGPFPVRRALDLAVQWTARGSVARGLHSLGDRVMEDIAAGRVVQPEPVELPSERVKEAAAESLAERG